MWFFADCQFGDVSKITQTDNCAQYIAANPSRCNNAMVRQQCCVTCGIDANYFISSDNIFGGLNPDNCFWNE